MKKGLTLSLVLSMCVFSTLTLAETFNVSTTQEFRQALLDAAQNGQEDTIILTDGIYKTTDDGGGTFTFLDNENYDLTIKGSSTDNVILSGDLTHEVLNFNVVESSAIMYLDSLSVVDGISGVYSNIGMDIQNCTISGNTTTRGLSGLSISGDLTLTNTTITGNTSGGLSVSGVAIIMDSSISGNSSEYVGGGIVAAGPTTITGSTISGNTARVGGGGIYVNKEDITIIDSIISDNSAGQDGMSCSDCGGGGIRTHFGDVTLINSAITGNRNISGEGGGLYVRGNATIRNSTISNNTNYFYNGGGLYVMSGITTISNSTISGNKIEGGDNNYHASNQGGGLLVQNVTITNSIISNNIVGSNGPNENDSGGGLYAYGTATILNSIIINNGVQYGIYLDATTNKIINSVFINNGVNDIDGDPNSTVTVYNNYIDESKVGMPAFFMNNISSGDLDFADPANCDFHIGPNSVLIDTGTTTIGDVVFPPTDFDGNPRVVGISIDIGPYEYTDDPNKKEPRPTECGYDGDYIFPGPNKVASPLEEINITFDLVLSGGVCSAETISDSSPPTDFRFIGPISNIEFTGTFTGLAEVCFDYDESGVSGDETSISLMHRQNSSSPWEEITTFVDTENNIVCGEINSFSEFAVAEPQAASDSGGGGGGGGGCFIGILLN